MAHVWSAFSSLSVTRSQGFSGSNPLSYTEVQNYMALTGTQLDPWEVDAVMYLDSIFLRAYHG